MKIVSNIKLNLILNLKNIPGWRIDRKCVIIECDDWGGIRMPSKIIHDKLFSAGIPVNKDRYSRFDTLEDKNDLEQLFEVLYSVKDKNDKPAVMTPITNLANPDFDKIRQSGFTEYHYEPFNLTLKRYGRHQETFMLWKEGIDKGIFVPESHGREHITVQLWMEQLKLGDGNVRMAFDNEFVAISTKNIPPPAQQFRPEFYYTRADQQPFLEASIKDGVKLFYTMFGYKPTIFVPSNCVFHPNLEPVLANIGIKFLLVSRRNPIYNQDGTIEYRRYTFGQKADRELRYYFRNCAFEPTDESYKGIGLTLKQIEAAFRWKKPAIISSHRVNFIGGIDEKNRQQGLSELKLLLKSIVKRWPDVEFLSSRDLFLNWNKS